MTIFTPMSKTQTFEVGDKAQTAGGLVGLVEDVRRFKNDWLVTVRFESGKVLTYLQDAFTKVVA